MQNSWKNVGSQDFAAGAVVALVALPLCLGISLASGAPLFSGLIAGIAGGIVVGALSGSATSVSGPTAAQAAIVAALIVSLGSFEAFLTALFLAGAFQIGLGLCRVGFLTSFFPTSVIKGLLAAIGLIIILKQVPHLIGYDLDPIGDMAFSQPDHETTLSEIPKSLQFFLPGAALIGGLSLGILSVWSKLPGCRRVPMLSPLAAVLSGVGVNQLLWNYAPALAVGPSHLVQVPVAESFANFCTFFSTPDLAAFANPAVYSAALTLGLIASLESLVTIEAVDKLDPQRRKTPPDRELLAQGFGNMLCGAIGGLPVSSVILRGSANINAGAQTKAATMVHGGLLLGCISLGPSLLNQIPLASLAAILIATGYRLTSPKIVKRMWSNGPYQFLPFAGTVVAILFTDLMVGIAIGLGISLLFTLRSNFQHPIRRVIEQHLSGNVLRMELGNQVSFFNRAAIQKALFDVPAGGKVLVDATNTDYIDPDVLDLLTDFKNTSAPARGVEFGVIGFREKYPQIGDDTHFLNYSSLEIQSDMTPQRALEILLEGNERFRKGQRLKRDLSQQLTATAAGQHPIAVVLSCIDSRSPAELLFDLGLGDIFSVRVAGNIATREVLGSIEYACVVAGAKLIVVLGHTRCGAVTAGTQATCHPDRVAAPGCTHVEPILQSIARSVHATDCRTLESSSEADRLAIIDQVASRNVVRTVAEVIAMSPAIGELLAGTQIGIVGMMYDVGSGTVRVIEETLLGPAGTSNESISAKSH